MVWQNRRGRLIPKPLQIACFQRDHFTCQRCGYEAQRMFDGTLNADHIIPRSRGGQTVLENLQTMCVPCHKQKTRAEANAWKRKPERHPGILTREQAAARRRQQSEQ